MRGRRAIVQSARRLCSSGSSGSSGSGSGGNVLTHIDRSGAASMVDVSAKSDTQRTAVAGASVHLGPVAFAALTSGNNAKGNVLATARLAGIMAAKRTSELIPLCHPVALSHVAVELLERPEAHALDITASATCTAPTGVEMEALTAASVAALTVYDMCKAASKGIVISEVRLLKKTGGKSGEWTSEAAAAAAAEEPKPARDVRDWVL